VGEEKKKKGGEVFQCGGEEVWGKKGWGGKKKATVFFAEEEKRVQNWQKKGEKKEKPDRLGKGQGAKVTRFRLPFTKEKKGKRH